MNNDQFYANGRIAVLSTKLLGADKFTRIAECLTVAEALKVLNECGYGGGVAVNPNDYEKLLIAELDSAMALLRELCFDKNATAYFLCRYNYHNAKTLMKCKYLRLEGVFHCFSQADIAPENLQQAFVQDDYSLCSSNMAEACDAIDMAFANGQRSPQTIDLFLDRAMFADMNVYAKKSSIALVRKLFDWEVNTINIMLVYRLKRAAQSKSALENWFVKGGSIKRSVLENFWDNEARMDGLADEYKQFFALCTQENANLSVAESIQKAQRNKIIVDAADFLTIQPVVKYFFDKVDEIDKVRFALISIKTGADKEKLKNKLAQM